MKTFIDQVIKFDGEQTWQPQARASVVCLALLVAALIAGFTSPVLSMVLFLGSFAAGMRYSLPETAQSLAAFEIDVDFLMILVALGAWFLGHPGEGAFLLVLFSASRAMETFAHECTRVSVRDLMSDLPRRALTIVDGVEREVPCEDLVAGDIVLVRPGERFAVDGEIIEDNRAWIFPRSTGKRRPSVRKRAYRFPQGRSTETGS